MIAQGLSAHFAQEAERAGGGMLAHLAVILAEGQVQHVVEALHRPVLPKVPGQPRSVGGKALAPSVDFSLEKGCALKECVVNTTQ